jgi:hypothetical protein
LIVRTLAGTIAAACSGETIITSLEHAEHQVRMGRRRFRRNTTSSISMVISVRLFFTPSRLSKRCSGFSLWTKMPLR